MPIYIITQAQLTFQIARNARAGSTASCLIKGIQCKGMAGPNTRDLPVAHDDVAISNGRKLDGRFFYRYKNIILPRLCPSSSIEALGQKTFSDDDIIVLGYPRSGSTWTMDMIQMLINCDFSELERNANFKFRVDALELDFAPAFNGTTYHKLLDTVRKPRQLRTHLAYDFLPLHMFHTNARFIHITRNPKDVLVSLFHFYRSNKDLLGQWPGTWAEYFDMFLNKELVYGDWFDHTRGFWERRHNSRMLTLRYEEMLSNPCETVQNLAEFLEIPKSDEDIAKIVELTHFNIIREDPTTNFHRSFHHEHPFCRKGQVGDWKNIFSAEQSEILDRLCAEKIEPLGLKFKFE